MTPLNNETLQAEKLSFDNLKKDYKGFEKKAHPAVLAYLKEYIATGKYPYNAQVRDFILTKHDIAPELHDHLDTEVYLAQKDLKKEKEVKEQQDMADKGYIPCREWKGYEGRAELVGRISIDWFSGNINKIGKIVITNDGKDGFFIPKGKRTRGYYIRSLDNAYYKAI